jgi:beta-phosphoglucomutase-like phosphatase (HAD superfamily)
VRQSSYAPTAPPKPLDQEEQRRLTIYDQQTEADLHEQAMEAWRLAESERRERWEAEHSAQERAAAEAFNAAANSLQQLHPELLQAGSPPRLNRDEVERFSSCKPERFR